MEEHKNLLERRSETMSIQKKLTKYSESQPTMTFKSRVLLGPLKKYKIFGRFPLEFMLHILLVLFTSTQLLVLNKTNNVYSVAQRIAFYKIFLDEEFDLSEVNLERYKDLSTVSEMAEQI